MWKATAPACQRKHDRRPDLNKRCLGALLDNTGEWVIIIHENSFPKRDRKWGFPKGKFKIGENGTECMHREVCEEVGVDVSMYSHEYRKTGINQIVVFDDHRDDIPLFPGPEALQVKWVRVDWLKKDIARNPTKYNLITKKMVKHL